MTRLTRLLLLATFTVCWLGCSAMESADETQSATTLAQPWICAPATYNPLDLPNGGWPNQGWCQWMPSTSAGIMPLNVSRCDTDPIFTQGHPPSGSIDAFSGQNYTGNCARIGGTIGGGGAGFLYDYAHVEVNGWNSIRCDVTKGGLTCRQTAIQSVVIGNRRTGFTVWSDGGSNPNVCNSGTCIGYYNDPYDAGTWLGIPTWQSQGLASNFVPAMFRIGAIR